MFALPRTGRLAPLVVLGVAALLSSCTLTSDLSGTLTGRVLSAAWSQPIPGAVVQCEGQTTLTDYAGFYALYGLPSGDSVVCARAVGFANCSEIVNIDGSTRHDIYMSDFVGEARLSGHVAHAMLGPIEGASVSLGDLVVVTDSLGFYEYENVEQVTYRMIVTADDYRRFSAPVHVNSEDFRYDVNMMKLVSVVLECDADADVRETSPGTNYGDEPTLDLYHSDYFHHRFYIRFPFDLEPSAVPVDARLRLYNTWVTGDTASARTILVARLLGSLSEMQVTWMSMIQTTGASQTPGTYVPRWYEVDVTTYFIDWMIYGDSNHGLMIDTTRDQEADRFDFASREYPEEDKRPHIELDYAW